MATAPSLKDLCSGPATFMGVPSGTALEGAAAAILGIPFDMGAHAFRVGARQGPASIREQSRLIRHWNPEFADFPVAAKLGLVDAGDVRVVPGRHPEAFAAIESAVGAIVDAGAVPITLGADGSISLPVLRAVARRHRGLAVIHIDSHTDSAVPPAPGEHNTGTQFHYAAVEELVDTTASWHIGVRGTTYRPGGYAHTEELGYRIVTMNRLMVRGIPTVMREVRESLGDDRPVYLCFDMDAFDPSCAPGVCAPSWGGLSAREGIDLLRRLHGMNIVAVDVNTVSPPHDVNGMAAFLAANVVFESMMVVAARRFPDEVRRFELVPG
ncbi:MAG: arginase family protein [Pseudomonadota bacterium]